MPSLLEDWSNGIEIKKTSLLLLSFAGLVVVARSLNPIPSRTRPLNSSAPMVLRLKTRESRSLPGLQRTRLETHHHDVRQLKTAPNSAVFAFMGCDAQTDHSPNMVARGGAAKGLGQPRPSPSKATGLRTAGIVFRGVEQPGSSSGS